MLLRSASTPLLNSFTPHASKDSSPESESVAQLPRTRSITLTASSSGSFSPVDHDHSPKRMSRALSESNLRDLAVPKKKPPLARALDGLAVEEEEKDLGGLALEDDGGLRIGSFGGMFLGSGLDKLCDVGGTAGGGGSDGGDGGHGGFGNGWENDRGNESTDAYYQKMIRADPGNPLLLSNYAKYLKELRGDLVKAEEYCGRAILANPNDGDTLSMYGDLVWQQHKDAARAETYFDQAVKASPDDCYVMASYARFLWDAEEDDDEEVAEEPAGTSPPSFFHGIPPSVPPIAAAS
ncbi:uncharacterized protein LOC116201042 [Punica granatum]|uniref:Uncharacterized protein LOC116201042 n=2 Tax=Punica granatum TaxID=22663 RepID=A0A218W1B9_PUNGR|nr:uncharacterized protein LOC116201042 [Punica granatum]OWM65922.1 hypothetical protein CDL15_Pgr015347 [Punica granatum]